MDWLARLGFCSRGVVYAVIGLLGLNIAWRGTSGDASASKEGALREISERYFGRSLLLVLAVGLAGYAMWRLSEALWGKRDEDDDAKRTAKRLLSAGKAGTYLVLLASTLKFVSEGPSAGGSQGDEQEQTMTARVLELPGGRVAVIAVGLALIAGGLYVIYRGLAQKFDKRLDTSEMGPVMGRAVDVAGTYGLLARGLVFALLGFVLVKAAVDFDPEKANGIDGTLKLIASHAYGTILLTATALGLIAYGIYSLAEARYRQL